MRSLTRTTFGLGLTAALCLSAAPALAKELVSPYGFTAQVPDSWVIDTETKLVYPTVRILKAPYPQCVVNLKVSNPDDTGRWDPLKAIERIQTLLKEQNPKTFKVGEQAWVSLEDTRTVLGTPYVQITYVTFRNKRSYTVEALAPPGGTPPEFAREVVALVRSMTFQEPQPNLLPRGPAASPEPTPEPETPTEPEPGPEPKPVTPLQPVPEAPETDAVVKNALDRRYGTQLVSARNEYDRNLYTVRHLLDDDPKTLWRSRPGTRFPHEFVFALQTSVEVLSVEIVNSSTGLPGTSAKQVVFEGSTDSESGPWTPLAPAITAGENYSSPANATANARARWVRVRIESNHGHPTLTQVAGLKVLTRTKLRLFAEDTAAADKPLVARDLSVDRLRLSRSRNGPDDGAVYRAGSKVYINFKPRSFQLNSTGNYYMVVDLEILGAEDKPVFKRPKLLDHYGKPAQPPLSDYVAISINIPERMPTGTYKLRLKIRDGLANKAVTQTLAFEVLPSENAPKTVPEIETPEGPEKPGETEDKKPDAPEEPKPGESRPGNGDGKTGGQDE